MRVAEFAELSAIARGTWLELHHEEPALWHPMFHPVWTRLVAEVRNDIRIAVIGEMSSPVAFLPVQVQVRQGWPVGWPWSDAHGLIAPATHPGDPIEWLKHIGLRCWHFDHLPAGQHWFQPYRYADDPAWQIDLDCSFADFLEHRRRQAPSRIANVQRKARKLARELGPLKITWHNETAAARKALVTWKRRHLRKLGHRDLLEPPWVRCLIERLCQIDEAGFHGVLSTLHAGDRLVSVQLAQCSGKSMCIWIPTYDPELAAYSPGSVLHLKLIEQAIQRGFVRIDLGRGENPLKRALATSTSSLGLGCLHTQSLHRFRQAAWFRLREKIRRSPFRDQLFNLWHRWKGTIG